MATLQEAIHIKDRIVEVYISAVTDLLGGLILGARAFADNIVGVGVGWHFSQGAFIPGDWVVRVYVRVKLAPQILGDLLLPDFIENVRIDVVESGRFQAISAGPTVTAGSLIGLRGSLLEGTAGAIVEGNNTRCILTCSHVLHGQVNDVVVLRHRDGQEERVGRLIRASHLAIGPASMNVNPADAAVVQLDDGVGFSAGTHGLPLPFVSDPPNALTLGTPVAKLNSHPQTGAVFDVDATLQVDYSFGSFWFQHQILVHSDSDAVPFGVPGESGTLVTHNDGQRLHPVGLLFASGSIVASTPVPVSTPLAAVCPISTALAAFPDLNLRLVV